MWGWEKERKRIKWELLIEKLKENWSGAVG